MAATFRVMPLPGTKLWQMGVDEGRDLKGWDDIEKMKGMVGTKFKNPEEMGLAAFQLTGRVRAIEDRQNIARGAGGYMNYVKLAKHSLDNSFPRVMRAFTGLKAKLSQ